MWRFAAISFLVITLGTDAGADMLEGAASVLSGDTLELQGQQVRLLGIDAPERAQSCWDATGQAWPCGEKAALALSQRIGRSQVSCTGMRRDREDRLIAVCRLGDENINAWLVAAGWALAYRGQSHAFVGAEEAAREAGIGLWAGAFEPPWIWRTKNEVTPPK